LNAGVKVHYEDRDMPTPSRKTLPARLTGNIRSACPVSRIRIP